MDSGESESDFSDFESVESESDSPDLDFLEFESDSPDLDFLESESDCLPDLLDSLDSDEIIDADDLRELDFESMGRGRG